MFHELLLLVGDLVLTLFSYLVNKRKDNRNDRLNFKTLKLGFGSKTAKEKNNMPYINCI